MVKFCLLFHGSICSLLPPPKKKSLGSLYPTFQKRHKNFTGASYWDTVYIKKRQWWFLNLTYSSNIAHNEDTELKCFLFEEHVLLGN